VLALAPFFLSPVLFLTLPLLVWLMDGALTCPLPSPDSRSKRLLASAWVGWLFAFGYFSAGLFWIGEAFLVEAERFAWALPLAVTLLPAGLALFWGGAAAAAGLLWRPGLARVVALALTLAAAEWLRGHVLTGFPWNVIGYALTWPLPLMQTAGLLGIYGLTLIAVIVFAWPFVVLASPPPKVAGRREILAAALPPVLVIGLLALYGGERLWRPTSPLIPGVRLRLVQPSVPQRDKWQPEKAREIFIDHLTLSLTRPDGTRDDLKGISHVIWPEAAMPFLPLNHPEALTAIGNILPEGTSLLSGALRVEDDLSRPGRRRGYNSLLAFGSQGSLVGIYDKIHLVPFGEYLPMQQVLESIGLEQLTRWRGGFTAGASPRPVLHLPGMPAVGALICYEAIFPGAVVQGGERPELLVNLTNDGWFGVTTGPYQHFHQARVRAVEEGLSLVRVANNGITALIDPEGRALARIGLNERGTIDTDVPRGRPATLYSRYGDLPFAMAWLALFLGLLARNARDRGRADG
jgi:apolipoprotein N-acyltransferase